MREAYVERFPSAELTVATAPGPCPGLVLALLDITRVLLTASYHPGIIRPMEERPEPTFTAFAGSRRIAGGPLAEMLRKTWRRLHAGESETLLIFDDETGRQVDFDFRGSADEVVARALGTREATPAATRGRPKLGVVAREVTLLPRHWEWLGQQANGISAALRRLVDEARKREPQKERARLARDAASRFMTAMAGDRPGYEEASRALFAGDRARLAALIRPWPRDVRGHVERLLQAGDGRPYSRTTS